MSNGFLNILLGLSAIMLGLLGFADEIGKNPKLAFVRKLDFKILFFIVGTLIGLWATYEKEKNTDRENSKLRGEAEKKQLQFELQLKKRDSIINHNNDIARDSINRLLVQLNSTKDTISSLQSLTIKILRGSGFPFITAIFFDNRYLKIEVQNLHSIPINSVTVQFWDEFALLKDTNTFRNKYLEYDKVIPIYNLPNTISLPIYSQDLKYYKYNDIPYNFVISCGAGSYSYSLILTRDKNKIFSISFENFFFNKKTYSPEEFKNKFCIDKQPNSLKTSKKMLNKNPQQLPRLHTTN